MKRPAVPVLSLAGQQIWASYQAHLQEHQDLAAASRRNYLSDLRQFIAWCEDQWVGTSVAPVGFGPRLPILAKSVPFRIGSKLDFVQGARRPRPASRGPSPRA